MDNTLIILINLLEEEFRDSSEVRISPVFPSGTERSVDLIQDYDPESNDTHLQSGVKVSAENREFFFPTEWLSQGARTEIHRQIEQIRDILR